MYKSVEFLDLESSHWHVTLFKRQFERLWVYCPLCCTFRLSKASGGNLLKDGLECLWTFLSLWIILCGPEMDCTIKTRPTKLESSPLQRCVFCGVAVVVVVAAVVLLHLVFISCFWKHQLKIVLNPKKIQSLLNMFVCLFVCFLLFNFLSTFCLERTEIGFLPNNHVFYCYVFLENSHRRGGTRVQR